MAINHQCKRLQSGIALAELLVAGTLLIAGLAMLSQGAVQTKRLMQDVRHYELALDELSNQVEQITALQPADRRARIDELQASERMRLIFPNPVLKGKIESDGDGERLVLSLHWDRRGQAEPIKLIAWLPSADIESLVSSRLSLGESSVQNRNVRGARGDLQELNGVSR